MQNSSADFFDVASTSVSSEPAVPSFSLSAPRDVWLAMRRGFMRQCPACGEGPLFKGYLAVCDACPACHAEMHHQRADDAPPYFTIMVVGHVVGTMMLLVEETNDALPLWIHAVVWPLLTLAMSLILLPRFKGALIGLQWANKMHGFATAVPGVAQALASRSLPSAR